MGWHNPRVPWQELERALAGRVEPTDRIVDGIDAPASKRRSGYVRPVELATSRGTDDGGAACRVPYAELHCHSNFSFLDGASHPEELVEEAARLELDAVALTDHDGMYGVARFAEAARDVGVRTVFGTELSLGLSAPQNGVADPEGEHLLMLAKGQDGYAALCRAVTAGQLAGHEHADGPDTAGPGAG
ncbi:PHP domain-containing protein, partial [Saccharomonospora saliphila]|uniref:PHP domain-containing protein n=1 Tax=Saccharomonospora saliphila TaxID=369829 RepID=UPI0012FA2588